MRTLALTLVAAFALPSCALAQNSEDAITAWDNCLVTSARKFAATSTEPAQTIVSASFGMCSEEERGYVDYARKDGIKYDGIERLVAAFKKSRTERLSATILIQRSK